MMLIRHTIICWLSSERDGDVCEQKRQVRRETDGSIQSFQLCRYTVTGSIL